MTDVTMISRTNTGATTKENLQSNMIRQAQMQRYRELRQKDRQLRQEAIARQQRLKNTQKIRRMTTEGDVSVSEESYQSLGATAEGEIDSGIEPELTTQFSILNKGESFNTDAGSSLLNQYENYVVSEEIRKVNEENSFLHADYAASSLNSQGLNTPNPPPVVPKVLSQSERDTLVIQAQEGETVAIRRAAMASLSGTNEGKYETSWIGERASAQAIQADSDKFIVRAQDDNATVEQRQSAMSMMAETEMSSEPYEGKYETIRAGQKSFEMNDAKIQERLKSDFYSNSISKVPEGQEIDLSREKFGEEKQITDRVFSDDWTSAGGKSKTSYQNVKGTESADIADQYVLLTDGGKRMTLNILEGGGYSIYDWHGDIVGKGASVGENNKALRKDFIDLGVVFDEKAPNPLSPDASGRVIIEGGGMKSVPDFLTPAMLKSNVLDTFWEKNEIDSFSLKAEDKTNIETPKFGEYELSIGPAKSGVTEGFNTDNMFVDNPELQKASEEGRLAYDPANKIYQIYPEPIVKELKYKGSDYSGVSQFVGGLTLPISNATGEAERNLGTIVEDYYDIARFAIPLMPPKAIFKPVAESSVRVIGGIGTLGTLIIPAGEATAKTLFDKGPIAAGTAMGVATGVGLYEMGKGFVESPVESATDLAVGAAIFGGAGSGIRAVRAKIPYDIGLSSSGEFPSGYRVSAFELKHTDGIVERSIPIVSVGRGGDNPLSVSFGAPKVDLTKVLTPKIKPPSPEVSEVIPKIASHVERKAANIEDPVYGQHGLTHVESVYQNMMQLREHNTNLQSYSPETLWMVSKYHDIAKFETEIPTVLKEYPHGEVAAEIVRQNKLNIPELNSRPQAELNIISEAIYSHHGNPTSDLGQALKFADMADGVRFGGKQRFNLDEIKTPRTAFENQPFDVKTPLATALIRKNIGPTEVGKIDFALGTKEVTQYSGLKLQEFRPHAVELAQKLGAKNPEPVADAIVETMREYDGQIYGSFVQWGIGREFGFPGVKGMAGDFDITVSDIIPYGESVVKKINKIEGEEFLILKKGGQIETKYKEKMFDVHENTKTAPLDEIDTIEAIGEKDPGDFKFLGIREEEMSVTKEGIPSATMSFQMTAKFEGAMNVYPKGVVFEGLGGKAQQIAPTHVGRVKDIMGQYFGAKLELEKLDMSPEFRNKVPQGHAQIEGWLDQWDPVVGRSVRSSFAKELNEKGLTVPVVFTDKTIFKAPGNRNPVIGGGGFGALFAPKGIAEIGVAKNPVSNNQNIGDRIESLFNAPRRGGEKPFFEHKDGVPEGKIDISPSKAKTAKDEFPEMYSIIKPKVASESVFATSKNIPNMKTTKTAIPSSVLGKSKKTSKSVSSIFKSKSNPLSTVLSQRSSKSPFKEVSKIPKPTSPTPSPSPSSPSMFKSKSPSTPSIFKSKSPFPSTPSTFRSGSPSTPTGFSPSPRPGISFTDRNISSIFEQNKDPIKPRSRDHSRKRKDADLDLFKMEDVEIPIIRGEEALGGRYNPLERPSNRKNFAKVGSDVFQISKRTGKQLKRETARKKKDRGFSF